MLSQEKVASLLREQANVCAAFGSALYGDLLSHASENAVREGVVFELLRPFEARNPRADALALRLMAAVHRLVLGGHAAELALHYPSVGGFKADPWPAFERVLAAERERLPALIALPCQTNEVGRTAALAFGFFDIAASTRMPLRLLEVGASAGLNLRWDHYRFGVGDVRWGFEDSPVDLHGLWKEAPRVIPAGVEVSERRGCDPQPVDPSSDEGRLSLLASVWADQVARVSRLRGAFEVAARVPVEIQTATVRDWLPEELSRQTSGQATIVYHSIVQEYFDAATATAFHSCLAQAGQAATSAAPLFWLRLEPVKEDDALRYAVSLKKWPGGSDRVVAWSGPHGSDVRGALA
jgi:hypothetical protein